MSDETAPATVRTESRIVELLRRIEWSGRGRRYDYGDSAAACPECGGEKPVGDEDDADRPWCGHQPGCALSDAIAAATTASEPVAHAAIGAQPPTPSSGPSVQLGEVLFSFNSFQDWVNKAQRIWRFHEVDSRHTVCIDQRGRICGWGAHFMRARDEGAFPINVHRLRPPEETGL